MPYIKPLPCEQTCGKDWIHRRCSCGKWTIACGVRYCSYCVCEVPYCVNPHNQTNNWCFRSMHCLKPELFEIKVPRAFPKCSEEGCEHLPAFVGGIDPEHPPVSSTYALSGTYVLSATCGLSKCRYCDNKAVTGAYCLDCKCELCDGKAVRGSDFCSAHKCPKCNEGCLEGLDSCEEHLCFVGKESAEDSCGEPAEMDSIYCRSHKCTSCKGRRIIGHDGTICTLCNLPNEELKQRRIIESQYQSIAIPMNLATFCNQLFTIAAQPASTFLSSYPGNNITAIRDIVRQREAPLRREIESLRARLNQIRNIASERKEARNLWEEAFPQ